MHPAFATARTAALPQGRGPAARALSITTTGTTTTPVVRTGVSI